MTTQREENQARELPAPPSEMVASLLDSLPMGMAILDLDLVVRRFNSAWATCIQKFSGSSIQPSTAGFRFFELVPEFEQALLPAFRRALGGETVHVDPVRVEAGGTANCWDILLTPLLEDGAVKGVLYVATDATDRRQAEDDLQARIDFENLITTISTSFINLDLNEVDEGITNALRAIGQFAGVDRAYITLFSKDRSHFDGAYEWVAGGVKPQTHRIVGLPFNALQWSSQSIVDCRVLHVPRVLDLPPEAEAEKVELTTQGVQSFIAVPLIYRESAIGILGFDSERAEKSWPEENIKLLKIVGEMFVNVLERKWTEEALGESRRTLATLMSNLPGMAYRCRNDRQRTVEFVSEGCLELTGFAPLDLTQGKLSGLSELIDLEDREMVWQETQAALGERRPFRHVYRLATALGEQKWVWEQGRGVFDDAGRLLAIEGFANDVTERVLAYQTLEERVEERTKEIERRRLVAEGLRDILGVLNSNRSLEEILDYIVTLAGKLLGTDAVAIYRLEPDSGVLSITSALGLPDGYAESISMPVGYGAVGRAVAMRQPVAVGDLAAMVADGSYGASGAQLAHLERLASRFGALLAIPLTVKDRIYGGIVLYYPESREFDADETGLATAFADEAAMAIENAHLRAQVEATAVAAERSRLARDLHDAVTQTLFSASLIAEVLPRLWGKNMDEGLRRLEELRQLTRGALAEMRTLLLELRPAALTEAAFGDLLRQLGEATTGRARIPVSVEEIGRQRLPQDVQIGLYRIAQEALNNVAKHSGASHAQVQLNCEDGAVALTISDDGRGFQLGTAGSDHLGLNIMKERAEAIAACLIVDSTVGKGTRITATWRVTEISTSSTRP